MRVAAVLLLLASLAPARDRLSEKTLERFGIRPTVASIAAYLRSHFAEGEKLAAIRQLIAYLGADDFHLRTAAARELGRMGAAPLPALRAAARAGDPELRRIAAALAGRMDALIRPHVLRACFRTIHGRRLGGLAQEVLRVLPLCEADFVHSAGCSALRTTSGPQDAVLLRASFVTGPGRTRFAAALAYGSLLKGAAAPHLKRALASQSDHLRLGAARALAQIGDRSCLAPLGALLDSPDAWVRLVSAQTLRAMSGKRFGFSPFDTGKHRRDAVQEWRRELRRIRTWQTPLKPRSVELGRTLVSHWTENRLIELDYGGAIIWEIKVAENPWANCGLPNGHRIVTFYKSKAVVEYDSDGRQVWRKTLPGNPTSVARLPNGHTLVACPTISSIVELGASGVFLRKISVEGQPTDAEGTHNGNLLVTLSQGSKVVEMTRSGRVVWEYKGLTNPYSAQPLENGNVLVCEPAKGRVVELTRQGKVVWSRAGMSGGLSAQRLASGLTLVASRYGVRMIDADGNTRWTRRFTGYIYASHH